MSLERLPVADFHARCKGQGVSGRKHVAVVCPVCKTVQSIQSFLSAGVDESQANSFIGFSCVGRVTDAGPHKKDASPGRGCDWTLGGLFRIHELEVVTDDGEVHPHFVVASPEDAQALEGQHALALARGESQP